jgi:menaquinone-specific isochorismate synthase
VLWGSGTAAVIEVPAPWVDNLSPVSDALAAISLEDPEGSEGVGASGPVAFGALPFDRTMPGRFTIPATMWSRTSDGDRSRTDVFVPDVQPIPEETTGVVVEPAELTIRSALPPRQWCDAVSAARDRIRAGELIKVVLAREIEVLADSPIDHVGLWLRLLEAHPMAFCFAVDGFIGASPELLVSRSGSTVRARPMAGTTPRTGHGDVDQRRAGELLASEKNRSEHQITIDAVHDRLLGWCSYLDAEPSPSVVPAGPVQHLATLVEGRLSQPEPSVLDLVAALHPTPAVGGEPTTAALAVQSELEPASRGRYAGPVGWVDSTGNGTFAVGIRSIELDGERGRLFAGVGVVADSDPESELAESRAKAQAVLSAIARI